MREPDRILVVRLSALGDVLLATPAVRALARRFPEARVDWLVEAAYLPLVHRYAGAPEQLPLVAFNLAEEHPYDEFDIAFQLAADKIGIRTRFVSRGFLAAVR